MRYMGHRKAPPIVKTKIEKHKHALVINVTDLDYECASMT